MSKAEKKRKISAVIVGKLKRRKPTKQLVLVDVNGHAFVDIDGHVFTVRG